MFRANVVLAVVAAVLGVLTIVELSQDESRFAAWEDEPALFDGLEVGKIDRVRLFVPRGETETKEDGSVQMRMDAVFFAKNAGVWRLEGGPLAGAPVNGKRVTDSFIGFAEKIRKRRSSIVVENGDPEDFRKYGCTFDEARRIELLAGKTPVASLLIGKFVSDRGTGNALQGYYVRDVDSSDIVFYERRQWEPAIDPQRWIDNELHSFEAAKVQRFEFTGPLSRGVFAVARDPEKISTWKVISAPEGVGALRMSEVTRWVQAFALVRAQRIEGQAGKLDAAKVGQVPYVRVKATLDDGTEHELVVLNEVSNTRSRYAVVGGRGVKAGWIWSVDLPVFRDFTKDVSTALFDPAGAPRKNG